MQSQISLVKSNNHYKGVTTCLENIEIELRNALLNIPSFVIKVNFVDTRVELATTPFQAVKSFIDYISSFYNGEIIIVEAPSWGVKIDAFEKYGYNKLMDENPKVHLLNLRDDNSINKEIGNSSIPLSEIMLNAQFIVSIVRPKTHSSAVVTLGIKNVLVGAINGGIKFRYKIHKPLHQNLVQLSEFVYPDLVIIDGLIGMEGRGPIVGTEKKVGWCISSLDALAADTLGSYLMGHNIEDIGYLYLLGEASKGAVYPQDNIEIIGENPDELRNPFQPHPAFNKIKKWR